MPKRIPTPEPGDDEPKYFTVVQPYPLNANWELPHDYITFGRWIAGCIGPEPFFALFYKPSARGQVLLEINREYAHPERLLGEHRWSDFLRNPSQEEAGRVSQIFYSVYNTGRSAQKDGWKRINVADSWFRNWTPINPVIAHPYPPTVWCPLPPEDRTNKPMCRPLPVGVKPPPPPKVAVAAIVPGSATWATQKSTTALPPAQAQAQLRGAWASQAAHATSAAHAANGKGNASKNTQGGKNGKGKGGKAVPATSSAPWHTATAPKGNNIVPVSVGVPGQGPTATTTTLPFPPGLDLPAPPGLTRGGGGTASSYASTSTASTSSADAPFPVLASTGNAKTGLGVAGLTNGLVGISLSPSMEANLYAALGKDAKAALPGLEETSPDPNAYGYVAEWEKMAVLSADSYSSYADAGGEYDYGEYAVTVQGDGEVVASLWDDSDDVERRKAAAADAILCTVHGIICKKGICKEYARILREREREKGRAAGKGGNNNNNGGGGGGGRRNDNGWRKKGANPWDDHDRDDSGSATGSEERSAAPTPPAKKTTNDGWSTTRKSSGNGGTPKKTTNDGWSTVRGR